MEVFYVMLAIIATGVLSVIIYMFRHKNTGYFVGAR